MAAVPRLYVEHLDHDGGLISTHTPVGGTLRWSYRMFDPGTISYQIALSDPELTRDGFAPYRTDWQLILVDEFNAATPIHAGIHTPVGVRTGRKAFNAVDVNGLDWLHYLQQPYPFAYDQTMAQLLDDPDNLFKYWSSLAGATQADVVDDLLAAIGSLEEAVQLNPVLDGSGWSELIDKDLWFGDNRDVIDHIKDLASLGDPLGFDMFVEEDKTLRLTAPRNADPDVITPVCTLNDSNVVVPPLAWINMGPLATDTVVLGAGSGNTRTFTFKTYGPSRTTYRQWTKIRDVQLAGDTVVGSAGDAKGYQDRFPHKDLRVTIRPDLLDPADPTAGFRRHLGEAFEVNYDVAPYHEIDAFFWIVGQEFYPAGRGAWLCDLVVNQVYGTASSPNP